MNRTPFMWSFAALAGIVVTAALTWSASRFAGEHVGISSAPLSITSGLAPRRAVPSSPGPAKSPARPGTTTQPAPTISPTSTATITSPASTPAPGPRDDSGGGSGRDD